MKILVIPQIISSSNPILKILNIYNYIFSAFNLNNNQKYYGFGSNPVILKAGYVDLSPGLSQKVDKNADIFLNEYNGIINFTSRRSFLFDPRLVWPFVYDRVRSSILKDLANNANIKIVGVHYGCFLSGDGKNLLNSFFKFVWFFILIAGLRKTFIGDFNFDKRMEIKRKILNSTFIHICNFSRSIDTLSSSARLLNYHYPDSKQVILSQRRCINSVNKLEGNVDVVDFSGIISFPFLRLIFEIIYQSIYFSTKSDNNSFFFKVWSKVLIKIELVLENKIRVFLNGDKLKSTIISYDDWEITRLLNKKSLKLNQKSIEYYPLSPASHPWCSIRSSETILVVGDYMYQFFSKYNPNVKLVGSYSYINVDEIHSVTSLKNKSKCILILASYGSETMPCSDHDRVANVIANAKMILKSGNFIFKVRYHPAGKCSGSGATYNNAGIYSSNNYSLIDDLNESDCIIGVRTSALLHCFALSKPLLIIQPKSVTEDFQHAGYSFNQSLSLKIFDSIAVSPVEVANSIRELLKLNGIELRSNRQIYEDNFSKFNEKVFMSVIKGDSGEL